MKNAAVKLLMVFQQEVMPPMGTLLSVGLRTARFTSLCSSMKKNSWFGANFMQIVRDCVKCIEEQMGWTFVVFFADWTCSLFVAKVSEDSLPTLSRIARL